MSVTLKVKLEINTENPFSCTADRGRKFFLSDWEVNLLLKF